MDAMTAASRVHSVLPLGGSGLKVTRDGRTLLDDVDVVLNRTHGIVAIVGPNGAGKSLLLRVLAGLVRPDAGLVTWAGAPPDSTRIRSLGFVLQRPVLLRRSALANLEFAISVAGKDRAGRKAQAWEALERAGLADVADAPAHSLSGGEQQRLALARAMLLEPECLLLDEPTANLDPASTQAFETQISGVRSRGMPMLLVSQDLAQVKRLADRVIFLCKGRILEQDTAENFFAARKTRQAEAFFHGDLVL